jgi:putative sterol carrier protein
MSLDSHLLSLKTLFDPARAEGVSATLELRLGDSDFHAVIAGGAIELERGPARAPDAVIEAEPGLLLAAIHGRIDYERAVTSGELHVEGDRELVDRFVRMFPLPEPAAIPAAA